MRCATTFRASVLGRAGGGMAACSTVAGPAALSKAAANAREAMPCTASISTQSSGCVRALRCSSSTLARWQHTLPSSTRRCIAAASSTITAQGQQVQQQGDQQYQQQPTPAAVVLEVGGMKCGGCSAAVKRMLSQREDVESAAVNLLTETAAVQFKRVPGNDPSVLGPEAAKMLTAKGFPAQVRNASAADVLGAGSSELAARAAQRAQQAAEARRTLLAAWGLAAVSAAHHAGHVLHLLGAHEMAHAPLFVVLGNPWVSGVLGAAALLGPGRELLSEGFRSLSMGAPNMNSLVAVGCSTSFLVGAAAALFPSMGLGFDASFLEEPVMLLAFVLLGRALEAQAKVQAASDLTALASLLPASSRMVLDPGAAPGAAAAAAAAAKNGNGVQAAAVECIQVPTAGLRPGDVLRVLPGEKVPVDGVVLSGRGAADEAMLTGESRLVPKEPGSTVTGGTVVYEGSLDVLATNTGASSTLAGLARLVSEAQSQEAPVQRLADMVAGRFCYGVMAAAALTFGFWSLLGTQLWPHVLLQGGWADSMVDWAAMTSSMHGGPNPGLMSPSAAEPTALLLAVRLAVDVLVVACPCALGLATPTAVLVASSLGAKRGLLLRGGGEVLERLAGVQVVAMDKTGTLTHGKLRVTSIHLAPAAVSYLAPSTNSTQHSTANISHCSDGDGSASSGNETSNGNGSGRAAAPQVEAERKLLAAVAALEAQTRHPLAAAILHEAIARGITPLTLPPASQRVTTSSSSSSSSSASSSFSNVSNQQQQGAGTPGFGQLGFSGMRGEGSGSSVTTVPGCGVWGEVEGRVWWVGKSSWVEQQCSASSHRSTAKQLALAQAAVTSPSNPSRNPTWQEAARDADEPAWARMPSLGFSNDLAKEAVEGGGQLATSSVWVGVEGEGVVGVIRAQDTLRADAKAAVQALQQRGISVHMLSGDSAGPVAALAAAAGIPASHARGGMSPVDKQREVQRLKQERGSVAMVGDGVNDAPALATADVGIAMHGGLEAAGEASRVVLMGDRLGQVVEALDLGRATLSKIKANLVWALAYNALGIPLAAGALLPAYGVALNPSLAAAMMALSSVAVVSNSLLLRLTFRAPSLTAGHDAK